jgi:hypothetical protein
MPPPLTEYIERTQATTAGGSDSNRSEPAALGFVCKVVGKGVQAQEADEAVQLHHPVLEWSPGEAPPVFCHE